MMSELIGKRVVRVVHDPQGFIQIGWQGVIMNVVNEDCVQVKFDNLQNYKHIQALENITIMENVETTEQENIICSGETLVPAIINPETDIVVSVMPAIQFNKNKWINIIDQMQEAELTNAFIKKISDARIAIKKRACQPIDDFEQQIAEIIEHVEKRRAHLIAEKQRLEKLRQEAKQKEVSALIETMKAGSKLPAEYLANIILKSEYLQVTYKGKKLNDDIESQFSLQQARYDAVELEKQNQLLKIKAREALIKQYNAEYGFEHKYSDFAASVYSDEQVLQTYKNSAAQRDAEKQRQEAIAIKATESATVEIKQAATIIATPEHKVTSVETKNSSDYAGGIVQRKVLITAFSQVEILKAVAALRKSGFNIEFI